ncbi:MAG: hypothetical protein VXZ86_06880 [Bacteroidota bacterium]|nr:hypothetical protein [Bacteroidota bacterium]
MNAKGIGCILTWAALCMALIASGCSTTKATKGKCPTCPEWSTPSHPQR